MGRERYRAALEYIDSFVTGPSLLPGLSREERLARMRLSVPRTRYFLRLLGEPQQRYHVLHVGGTSGKGSTAKMLATILQVAGYKTGLHTTPYMQEPLEKIVVDNRPISAAGLADLVEVCRPAIEIMRADSPFGPPAYGELWLALALSYFASVRADFAVVEVRVGGRYDCTNLVEPLVSLITTVNFDHLVPLGETLAEIAWHKAGIIKKGIPVVTAARQPEVIGVLRAECEQQGALLLQVGKDTRYEVRRLGLDGGSFDFYGLDGARWRNVRVAMLGEHQIANAATAVTALQALRRFARVDIPEQAVRDGLEQARFPGRLEIVQRRPLVVLDGAHNAEKMEKLRLALETLFSYERLILVLGVVAKQGFASTVSPIVSMADQIIVTAPHAFGKDPVSPGEMARFICEEGFPRSKVLCEPDPRRAVERALAMSRRDDLVCITGSLYLLGEIREIWHPSVLQR
jgi:dihydrofolate synthase/folylpolyglutamate synthase